MSNEFKCEYCGGEFNNRANLWMHMKKEREVFTLGEEGVDFVVCQVCEMRGERLANHLKTHGMSSTDYKNRFPGACLVACGVVDRVSSKNRKKGGYIPIKDRKGAIFCDKCEDWYLNRHSAAHLMKCVAENPDKYEDGVDYVKCPECNGAFIRLGSHLKKDHGWSRDRVGMAKNEGLRMIAESTTKAWKDTLLERYGVDSPFKDDEIQRKRERTNLERYGVRNPFESKDVQDKVKKTNERRYSGHPMRDEAVLSRQNESAGSGPSELEVFFGRNSCDNVVYTGYGARVVTVKKSVFKFGKERFSLCPDFMVFSDGMKSSANAKSDLRKPMRGSEFTSKYVVELFGEYYHSEKVIGVSRKDHVRQVVEAYASIGIECLVLWENDVLGRWVEIEPMVLAWLNNAVSMMNNRCPVVEVGGTRDEVVAKSLESAAFWRELSSENRGYVVDEMCKMYGEIDFPYPSGAESRRDFDKLMEWAAKGSGKPSRFGGDCCLYFARSMVHARVKGGMSRYEMWNDQDLLRRTVLWHLENENGSHTARKFLNGMLHVGGFRVVATIRPARVVCWLRKHAKVVEGGLFFDPCAGWGGRMLAAYAMGMKYRAVDANPVLVDELNGMAKVLGIDAVVVYGSADDRDVCEQVLSGEKADLVFTSPPYFDRETYCDDPKQSLALCPDVYDWHKKFCVGMMRNAVDLVKDGLSVVFNVPKDFMLETVRTSLDGVFIEDIDVSVEFSKTVGTERLLFLGKSESSVKEVEPVHFVVCRLCSRRFGRLKWHLEKNHSISPDEYLKRFPGAPLQSEKDSERVADENKAKPKAKHVMTKAYRCPDGSVVRRSDAWKRAWAPDDPPAESILDASEIDLEEKDYVECLLCGHRGRNLTRHLRSIHGVEPADYDGEVKTEECALALSEAAGKTWDSRGRNEKVEAKSRKSDGLGDGMLRRLYNEEGLSDVHKGAM